VNIYFLVIQWVERDIDAILQIIHIFVIGTNGI
jgi:hypothetical protein